MNVKVICDSIQEEVKKIESEREYLNSKLRSLYDEIEKSRQKSQNEHAAQMAEYEKQIAEIQVYLNQIPTNVHYVKRIGRERPSDTSLLSQIALQANSTDRISDYEKLFEIAMGMKQYIEKLKSSSSLSRAETQVKENEYTNNLNQFNATIEQRYKKLFASENYMALVKYMSECKSDLRRSVGAKDLLIGRRYTDFYFPKEHHSRLKTDFGNYYDEIKGRLLVPFYINSSYGFKILLNSNGDLARQDEAVEGILYSLLCTDSGEDYIVQYIDRARMTGIGIGSFQSLLNEENKLFLAAPKHENEVEICLKKVSDICYATEEMLQRAGVRSIYEWEKIHKNEKQKKRILIILEGFPFDYRQSELSIIRNLIVNADRWGISFIISVDTRRFGQKSSELDKMTASYDLGGFTKFRCPSDNIQIMKCGRIDNALKNKFIIKKEDIVEKNKYTDWFDLHKMPDYRLSTDISGEKKRLPIRVPLGVDAHNELHYIEFGGMNFAGYLMGSAGSGKSTLIHTIIASILYNYHPDDVELWLVDFKMMEFSQYAENLPPHVKYIVLDYSPKVVCDLLDKISAELTRRTELFAKHREWNRNIDNVPVSAGMPRIFLIIDEFEKMAKILAGSAVNIDMPTYKKKLSSLFQEGRSSGFRVLLSSQNYEAGVNILEENARNNIGIRIAMKNENVKEMKSVLNLSEEVYSNYINRLQYLPPHQLLIVEKDLNSAKTMLHQLKTLWFPDIDEIKNLQKNLKKYFIPTAHGTNNNLREYRDKKANVINGKKLDSFEQVKDRLIELAQSSRGEGYFDEDVPVFWGNIQALDNRKPVWLTREKNQNLCLLAPQIYSSYAASIVLSTIKCFEYAGIPVRIIGYRRNPIYARYRKCWDNYTCTDEPMEADRWLERAAESIKNKKDRPMLIVLCGVNEIVEDIIAEKEEQAAINSQMEKQREKEQQAINESQIDKQPDTEVKNRRNRAVSEDDGLAALKMGVSDDFRKGDIKGSIKERTVIPLSMETGRTKPAGIQSESILDHIDYIQRFGSRRGIYLFSIVGTVQDISGKSKIKPDYYGHLLSFKIPSCDTIMRLREAVKIGSGDNYADDSICMYDGRENFTFRPFLHKDIVWNGWEVDENGNAVELPVD